MRSRSHCRGRRRFLTLKSNLWAVATSAIRVPLQRRNRGAKNEQTDRGRVGREGLTLQPGAAYWAAAAIRSQPTPIRGNGGGRCSSIAQHCEISIIRLAETWRGI